MNASLGHVEAPTDSGLPADSGTLAEAAAIARPETTPGAITNRRAPAGTLCAPAANYLTPWAFPPR